MRIQQVNFIGNIDNIVTKHQVALQSDTEMLYY